MHRLSERQKEVLLKYVEVMTYEVDCFTFGPCSRKFFKDAVDIFNAINVGCYSMSVDKEAKPNLDSEQIYLYVDFKQAQKLGKVLTDLTGKIYGDLPTTPPTDLSQIKWKPKEARKSKKKSEEEE
jgi:hypothetical protein